MRSGRATGAGPIACSTVCVVIGGILMLNLVPELLYRVDNGANPEVGVCSVADSETYGLHLTQMLVPQPSHRVEVLAKAGARASSVELPGEGGSYLGLIGVAGFVIGVAAAFGLMIGGHARRSLIRSLGELMLVAVLIGTVGGIGVCSPSSGSLRFAVGTESLSSSCSWL